MPIIFNPSIGQGAVPNYGNKPKQAAQPPAVGGSTNGGSAPSAGGTQPPVDLPNSSVYLNEANAANVAYQKAQDQLLAQRNSLYHQYGLTDTGAVDVNNPYGQYQSLLGSEGAALDQARNNSVSRGLGNGGLANQAEASLIPGQRMDQLNFQHMVDQAGFDYSNGLANASDAHTGALQTAYQDALQQALAQGLFDPAPADGSNNPTTTTVTTPTGTTVKIPTSNPPVVRQLLKTLSSKKVTANKTGATVAKGRGVISIH